MHFIVLVLWTKCVFVMYFCNVTCHAQFRILFMYKILFCNDTEHVPEVTVELETK